VALGNNNHYPSGYGQNFLTLKWAITSVYYHCWFKTKFLTPFKELIIVGWTNHQQPTINHQHVTRLLIYHRKF